MSDEKLGEALKFIVHFIGDIHQPLHVGFTGDEVRSRRATRERTESAAGSPMRALLLCSLCACLCPRVAVISVRAATPSTAPSAARRIVACTKCGTRI